MAKKPGAPAPQLVHIAAPSPDSASLSKEQKAFNRFTRRIARLEKDLAAFRAAATRLRQQVQTEYRPLQQAHNAQRAALVRVLDRALDTYKLSRTERSKIVALLDRGCRDLLERGFEELQPIFDKHAPPPDAAAEAELDRQTVEAMKRLMELQYGIEFDPAADVSTPEKMQAYVQQQLAAAEAEAARQEAEAAERRARRRKSPKQQAAEEQKKAEEKNITQAVRTLYMDLVKHLHPDREPDEAEKIRKTGLLQRVTAAYEAGELLTLLRLQLELERIDQDHLERLADDQLRYYNQLLREQARELEQALLNEQLALQGFTGQPYYLLPTPGAIDNDYQRQKAQLEAKIRQLTADVEAFEYDVAALKAFLKTYRLPKAGAGRVASW
jgi:hypothetical protein